MKIEELTPENAPETSIAELLDLRYRATQIYNSKFAGTQATVAKFMKSGRMISAIERGDLLTKNQIILRELRRRGEEAQTTQPIDREAYKKSLAGFDPGDLPSITVVKSFAAIHGEFVGKPKTTDLVNLNFRCGDDEMGEPIVAEIIEAIHKATSKDVVCEFAIGGPEDEHIPIYDLVLVPRLAASKNKAAPQERSIQFEATEISPLMEKWDEAKARDEMEIPEIRRAAAWWDARTPFEKMRYKLLHHRKDGTVVYRALTKAMADLTDERKGGRIPDDARKTAYDHLARHYRQFDKDPPPYKTNKADRRTILKPYPNEHACRMKDPDQYTGFSRMERTTDEGKKYGVIYGIRTVDGKRVSEEQAFRYPKSAWTEAEARAHCTDHKGLKFEPAIEKADFEFKITKVDQEKQMVGGIVYEPEAVDTQGEYTDAKEIESAQEAFMQRYSEDTRRIKVQHMGQTYHFPIIESFIPEKETQKGTDKIPAGAWWIMVKVTAPYIWDEIKAGRLTGFSMGGRARNA